MSPAATLWWVIVVVGLGTYGLRSAFIVGPGTREAPPWFRRLLRHVPTAALAALVTSAALTPPAGGAGVTPRLAALALAGIVAWRTRSVLLTLACGMAALWLFQWWLPAA